MAITDFLILSLFTWRIANMVYSDSQAGPFDLLHRIRYWMGIRYDEKSRRATVASPRWKRELASMHNCIYCMSFWYGVGATLLWFLTPIEWHSYLRVSMMPFALSAAVIFIQKNSKEK
jgi:hypothetical protein